MTPRSLLAPRWAPAFAAAALVGGVVLAGATGGGADHSDAAAPVTAPPTVPGPTTVAAPVVPAPVATASPSTVPPTAAPSSAPGPTRTSLRTPLAKGSAGESVLMVQDRLRELGFDPGPSDGHFGNLTRAAVWAFEKLVLQVPRSEATGVVTDEIWQRMQDPIAVQPRRPDAGTRNHTEVYLPEQVVAFFVEDRAVLISHMSSGTDEEWCDVVTISPGEYGNEDGTEPLERHECGRSNTPGGVYQYTRRVEGIRQSGLGAMWNPVYFNYGIAIHGAQQVPLEPASHGCIRVPMEVSERVQDVVTDGDRVWVWDGEHEPDYYGPQPPTFNWLDPAFATTTTTAPTTTTVAPTPAGAPASAAPVTATTTTAPA